MAPNPRRMPCPPPQPSTSPAVGSPLWFSTALLDEHQVPAWVREPLITTAYRPTDPPSLWYPVRDMFRWHNETLNIHTHLWASVYFIACTAFTQLGPQLAGASAMDRFLFAAFTLSAAATFGCSAVFHTFLNFSHSVFNLLHTMDLGMIVALVSTSTLLPVHLIFRCNPMARSVYLTLVTLASVVAAVVIVFGKQVRWQNIAVFAAITVFAVLPVCHGIFVLPTQGTLCPAEAVWGHICFTFHRIAVMYVTYAVGTVVYLTRIPERFLPKGKLDMSFHSHVLMHLFVTAAAAYHLQTCLMLSQRAPLFPCCH